MRHRHVVENMSTLNPISLENNGNNGILNWILGNQKKNRRYPSKSSKLTVVKETEMEQIGLKNFQTEFTVRTVENINRYMSDR